MSVAGRRGGVGGKRRPRGGRGGGGEAGASAAAAPGRAAGWRSRILRRCAGRDGRTEGTEGGTERAWAAAHLAGRPPGPPWADSAGQRRSPPRRRPRSVRARRPRGWVGWGAGRKTALGNVKLRSGFFFFFSSSPPWSGQVCQERRPLPPSSASSARGEARSFGNTAFRSRPDTQILGV